MVSKHHQLITGLSQVSAFFDTQIVSAFNRRTEKATKPAIADTQGRHLARISTTPLEAPIPATILKVTGPLDVRNFMEVIDSARSAIAAGAQKIIFDMSEVTGLRLTSMYVLHSIVAMLQGREPLDPLGGSHTYRAIANDLLAGDQQDQLILAGPQPQTLTQLAQMGFTTYLAVYEDIESAKAKL